MEACIETPLYGSEKYAPHTLYRLYGKAPGVRIELTARLPLLTVNSRLPLTSVGYPGMCYLFLSRLLQHFIEQYTRLLLSGLKVCLQVGQVLS